MAEKTTTGSENYPAPQLWISVNNGRLCQKQSCANPCAQFLVDFVDFDMWGDYDFDMYVSRRVAGSTEPCLLEWVTTLRDRSGWFSSVIRDALAFLTSVTTPPSSKKPGDSQAASAAASFRSSNVIKLAEAGRNSLSHILWSHGRSFDRFRDEADLPVAYDKLKELGLLEGDHARQECRILLQQRIAHIEAVEFERAAGAGEDEEARVYAEYEQLNNQLAELEADSGALELHVRQMPALARLWFPLDDDQWDTSMNLPASTSTTASLSGSGSNAGRAGHYDLRASPPSDALPQVLQLRHDGNFSMHAVRTIKYNYLIAFATS